MATSPPNILARSPSTRSTLSSIASGDVPELHRVPHGRIARARSASAFQLSEHNRRAFWTAATGRPLYSRPLDLVSEPDDHLATLVTPASLSLAPPNTCVLSTSTLASLEGISSSESHISASASSASSILEGSVDPQNLKNSMEFMMPTQYGNLASYQSSYQSSYMEQYTNAEQQQVLAQASPQPSSYAPSYATNSPMIASSPVASQRATSRDREQVASHHYQQVVPAPYDQSVAGAPGNYGYVPAPSPAAPIQYAAGYASGQDPYSSSAYGVGYPQMPGSYLPPQTGGYGPHYGMAGSGQSAAQLSTEDPSGVRVVTARPKPQCWEHGCNGRQFSTFSNLLRHQREKSGTAAKSECPRCGAVFTRTTARNGHLAHDKCKRKSTASASEAE